MAAVLVREKKRDPDLETYPPELLRFRGFRLLRSRRLGFQLPSCSYDLLDQKRKRKHSCQCTHACTLSWVFLCWSYIFRSWHHTRYSSAVWLLLARVVYSQYYSHGITSVRMLVVLFRALLVESAALLLLPYATKCHFTYTPWTLQSGACPTRSCHKAMKNS